MSTISTNLKSKGCENCYTSAHFTDEDTCILNLKPSQYEDISVYSEEYSDFVNQVLSMKEIKIHKLDQIPNGNDLKALESIFSDLESSFSEIDAPFFRNGNPGAML